MIPVRRYLCRCGAVMVVVPRGILKGRLYAAAAISLALGLWGLVGLSSPAVRVRVSPWAQVGEAARYRWITVARWVDAGAAGRLFPKLVVSDEGDRRAIARRLATALIGFAPPADRNRDKESLLYLGGAHAA